MLAFYYSWFDDATWNSGQLSDTPAERYVSADRAAMGRHIDQAKAAGIDLWIGEGVDTSHLTVFDGHYLYSNTWNPPADLTAVNQKFADRVAQMRAATGAPKLWVATVMPGYNDTGVRPNSGFARGRDGGSYYAQSWQAAIAGRPNWVVVTSFNEWPEGTYIEPSAAFGDAYLGLTAQYASQFRSGGGSALIAVAPEAVAAQAAPATGDDLTENAAASANVDDAGASVAASGTAPTAPTVFVQTDVLNLRAGPGTTYALLGAVVTGDALPILGKAAVDGVDWWRVDTVAGPAWVFGAHVLAAGPLDGVPDIGAAATESDADAAAHPVVGLKLTIDGVSVVLRPAGGGR